MSNMEVDPSEAEKDLRTVLEFLENRSVYSLSGIQIRNYFLLAKQVEIFHKQYSLKGLYMSLDQTNNVLRLTKIPVKGKYNLSRLANAMFLKFCYSAISPPIFREVSNTFINIFGDERLRQCVSEISGLKRSFNFQSVIDYEREYKLNVVATLFMEGYEQILISRPGAESRVFDILGELIVDQECAETVVAMFAVTNNVPENGLLLKKLLLQRLEQKFEREPNAHLWIKILQATYLNDAVSCYEPLIHFILSMIKSMSSSLTSISTEAQKSFLQSCVSFEMIRGVIKRLHSNKKCCQHVINFIVAQCAVNPLLWYSVLSSRHNSTFEEVTSNVNPGTVDRIETVERSPTQ